MVMSFVLGGGLLFLFPFACIRQQLVYYVCALCAFIKYF